METRYDKISKQAIKIFHTAQEFIDETRKIAGSSLAHHEYKRAKFVGRKFKSNEDAVDAVNKSWLTGKLAHQKMHDYLHKELELCQPTDFKRKRKWSEDNGDEVDIDRLMSGQNEYWSGMERRPTVAHTDFDIIVNAANNCGTASNKFVWRIAAATVLADALEILGFRCSVIAAIRGFDVYEDGYRSGMLGLAEIKAPGDICDELFLVNVCSGWCFRTAWFQHLNSYKDDHGNTHNANSWLGRSTTLNIDEIERHLGMDMSGTATLIFDNDILSDKAAAKKLKEHVAFVNDGCRVH